MFGSGVKGTIHLKPATPGPFHYYLFTRLPRLVGANAYPIKIKIGVISPTQPLTAPTDLSAFLLPRKYSVALETAWTGVATTARVELPLSGGPVQYHPYTHRST